MKVVSTLMKAGRGPEHIAFSLRCREQQLDRVRCLRRQIELRLQAYKTNLHYKRQIEFTLQVMQV